MQLKVYRIDEASECHGPSAKIELSKAPRIYTHHRNCETVIFNKFRKVDAEQRLEIRSERDLDRRSIIME